MTLSVPSCAACRVRAIGASAHDAPLACNCLAKSRVWLTEDVPRSTTTWPFRIFFRMPSPSNTARTCFALGRHRNTRSLCLTTSATEARDLGAFRTQPRQRLRRKVERDHALAALLHEIAADRLAHHAEADEADGLVVLTFFGLRSRTLVTSRTSATAPDATRTHRPCRWRADRSRSRSDRGRE